ncbi:MAG: trehalase-like domain-containing protein, partial [Caulobacteraceae bacterium]
MAEAAPAAESSRIEDHALIGDCETAALVDRDGSINWLCWPRFDSDACFAALLGERSNGFWCVGPTEPARVTRRYRAGTLILETRFETDAGAVTLIDFMPPRGDASHLVRIVRGEQGRVTLRMEMALRFGYGLTVPWVSRLADGRLAAIAGPDMVVLGADVETRGEEMTTVADFEIGAGESRAFVLTHGASHLPPPDCIDAEAALILADSFWRDWLGKARLDGAYAEAV